MYNSFRIKKNNLRIMYKSSGQIELFFMNKKLIFLCDGDGFPFTFSYH